MIPGYPLSELGMDTKAVGHLTGLTLQEDGWAFYIPTEGTTEARWSPYGRRPWIRMFDPVLPLHAVQVDWKTYLM